MNNKKELERAELHKTIWKIADELRGSVDGWDFKQYILGLLFYRFISENLNNYLNVEEHNAGNSDFDYSKLSDKEAEFGRKDTLAEKGFYILKSNADTAICPAQPARQNATVIFHKTRLIKEKERLLHLILITTFASKGKS